ncbi:UDP-N-acetylenolpyruvoylglucosamine reductase [hydrothermal vent metagenome]|uniref:UDP-N-acetylmuramate dehydrogenase n=1 Tax=hydrothermal vent metagenome TaxID=652676 RepID=A0A3B1DN02_9ZZZZ
MVPDQSLKERLSEGFSGDILTDVMLRDHTSLRIGGKADYLFIPSDPVSLLRLIEALSGEGIGYVMIGGGTNLLVTDDGLEDVVINMKAFQSLERVGDRDDNSGDDVRVFAQSGLPLQRLLSFCREGGLSGIEGLVGIPGTVGGAVFGNAGSYGYEIMDVVQRVTVLKGGSIAVLDREDITPTYRSGGFSPDTVILGVHMLLKRDDKGTLQDRMNEFLQMKKKTQPLGERSAGCIFKNPPAESAARLIDEAGYKGMRIGDIEISTLHANFFINKGQGSAGDFLALMDAVIDGIGRMFGIILEPEIGVIGKR